MNEQVIEDLPPTAAKELPPQRIDDLSPVAVHVELHRFDKTLQLTYWLLAAVAAATLLILAQWIFRTPNMPKFDGLAAEQAKQIVENHAALTLANKEQAIGVFDAVVAKSLIPILATVVGFLIGRRSS